MDGCRVKHGRCLLVCASTQPLGTHQSADLPAASLCHMISRNGSGADEECRECRASTRSAWQRTRSPTCRAGTRCGSTTTQRCLSGDCAATCRLGVRSGTSVSQLHAHPAGHASKLHLCRWAWISGAVLGGTCRRRLRFFSAAQEFAARRWGAVFRTTRHWGQMVVQGGGYGERPVCTYVKNSLGTRLLLSLWY